MLKKKRNKNCFGSLFLLAYGSTVYVCCFLCSTHGAPSRAEPQQLVHTASCPVPPARSLQNHRDARPRVSVCSGHWRALPFSHSRTTHQGDRSPGGSRAPGTSFSSCLRGISGDSGPREVSSRSSSQLGGFHFTIALELQWVGIGMIRIGMIRSVNAQENLPVKPLNPKVIYAKKCKVMI